jgi:uncharacterized membrane protein YphA (DoxX/SURF4 family)
MNERVPLVFLFPLRILVGLMLIVTGYQKFQGGWLHGTPLYTAVDGWLSGHKTYAFFIPMIESARAHPKIFGTLITMGELVIGASMVLGLLTRFMAVLGALMVFAFAFGAGQGLSPPGNAVLMGAIFFTFILVPPGRVIGIDQMLRGRLPRWLV